MRQSQLFTRTLKEAPRDEESRNAQLLIRAGFIQKEMAGVYVFLPLGYRVLQKIVEIIRQEMNAIGGQEVCLSALQNPETWKKTDRWRDEVIDVWFKTKLATGSEVGLATTHEEPLTKIMSQYIKSYKDLPCSVYQFQTKFRNELRAKAGLLRTHEFLMKDLYSFGPDAKSLDDFYQIVTAAYHKIFARLGLGEITFLTFASGGVFSKYSHEFQTLCSSGEDTIYLDRKKNLAVNQEVYSAEVLADLGLKAKELEAVRSIEVGNIFKLGTRFSEPLGLVYTDQLGKTKPVVMGSYGLGPGRLMGTIAETQADAKGLIWPAAVAPFLVHLLPIGDSPAVAKAAAKVYEQLVKTGIEVLLDDRPQLNAGVKFADADLLGLPWRLVVSEKTQAQVEIKNRRAPAAQLLSVSAAIKKFKPNVQ